MKIKLQEILYFLSVRISYNKLMGYPTIINLRRKKMENQKTIPNEIEVDVDIDTSAEEDLNEDIKKSSESEIDESLSDKISQAIENTQLEEEEESFGKETEANKEGEEGEEDEANIEKEALPQRSTFQLITFYDENGRLKKENELTPAELQIKDAQYSRRILRGKLSSVKWINGTVYAIVVYQHINIYIPLDNLDIRSSRYEARLTQNIKSIDDTISPLTIQRIIYSEYEKRIKNRRGSIIRFTPKNVDEKNRIIADTVEPNVRVARHFYWSVKTQNRVVKNAVVPATILAKSTDYLIVDIRGIVSKIYATDLVRSIDGLNDSKFNIGKTIPVYIKEVSGLDKVDGSTFEKFKESRHNIVVSAMLNDLRTLDKKRLANEYSVGESTMCEVITILKNGICIGFLPNGATVRVHRGVQGANAHIKKGTVIALKITSKKGSYLIGSFERIINN